jgi:uncharacterized protein YecT (DUF1311 family)
MTFRCGAVAGAFALMQGVAPVLLWVSDFNIGLARADASAPKDVETIQACLRGKDSDREQEACIGIIARPCIGDEGARAPSEVIACFDREARVWDQLLTTAYGELNDALDSDQRDKLREMQQSWLDTLERTCAFYYQYFQGSMANPMMANCRNRETARRALFLIGFADDLPQDKSR